MRVWDPAVRLLHWVLAASVLAAWLTTEWFVGWHRAYLYFLERIMRSPVGGGGDALRIPYWDWENPASRTLPALARNAIKPNGEIDLFTAPLDVDDLLAEPGSG